MSARQEWERLASVRLYCLDSSFSDDECPSPARYAPSLKPHARTLPALFQFQQHLSGDFFQGLEHAVALEGDGFHHRLVFTLQLFR